MNSVFKTMKQYKLRPVLTLSGLFLLALAIRGIYFFELSRLPYFDTILPVYDHSNFDLGALSFAEGDWLALSPNNSYSPLYKYFLGGIYFLVGRNFFVVYGLQFAMGALGAVLIFLIGKRLFDARVGLLAFAGFSLYSTEIIYEGIILRAAFITFLGIVSFYMLIRLRDSSGPKMLVACALVLSLFFQSRPNTLLCFPFIILYIHRYIFTSWEPQSRLKGWGIFLIPLLLSMVPLLIQCYLVHGRFVLFDSSGPTAFMAGNFIDYPGAGFDTILLKDFQKEYQMENLSVLPFIFQQIMTDPIGFLKMFLRKLFFYFNDLEAPSNLSIYLYLENSRILSFMITHFSLFSALGLIGIVLALQKKEKVFLLYAFLASLVMSVVIFHVVSRFRIPSAPFLILFAAYALGRACNWYYQREYKSVAVFVSIFLVLFYGLRVPEGYTEVRYVDYCNWSSAYMTEEKWFDVDKAETYAIKCLEEKRKENFDRGVTNASLASIYKLYGAFLIKRRDAIADKVLQNAFSIDPFDSELYRMYADFQMGRNKIASAMRHLHISRIANENDTVSLKNLIQLYYANNDEPGRLLAALKVVLPTEKNPELAQKVRSEILRLERLVEENKDKVKTFSKKAKKYFSEKKWQAALKEYEILNSFNAFDATLLIEEGIVHENLNDEEKALNSFYDALLINAENPELNKNLGNYYLSEGNLILAILHWTRYLKISPQGAEYISVQKRLRFYSQQLRLKSLSKQVFDLSREHNRHLYKIYRKMNVQLGL